MRSTRISYRCALGKLWSFDFIPFFVSSKWSQAPKCDTKSGYFISCGYSILFCLLSIFVCTSIWKCQYNFQLFYDFRPFPFHFDVFILLSLVFWFYFSSSSLSKFISLPSHLPSSLSLFLPFLSLSFLLSVFLSSSFSPFLPSLSTISTLLSSWFLCVLTHLSSLTIHFHFHSMHNKIHSFHHMLRLFISSVIHRYSLVIYWVLFGCFFPIFPPVRLTFFFLLVTARNYFAFLPAFFPVQSVDFHVHHRGIYVWTVNVLCALSLYPHFKFRLNTAIFNYNKLIEFRLCGLNIIDIFDRFGLYLKLHGSVITRYVTWLVIISAAAFVEI